MRDTKTGYGSPDQRSGHFFCPPLATGPLATGPLATGPLATGPLTTGPLTTGPLTLPSPQGGEGAMRP